MRANTWQGKRQVRIEEVPPPRILNANDAIVKVTSTAICGSDLHLYEGLVPGMERGDVLGHEFMGEVVEVGRSVQRLRVGDRVVVPFPIACGACAQCARGHHATCENSNPNAWQAEKAWGHSPAGVFGHSHLLGGFPGGQAELVRVPFADVGPLKVPPELGDEQVLFLSDILPTGYMGAEMCNIQDGDTVAVWGAGAVGQFAIASARLLGAEQIIAIDRLPARLKLAKLHAGATATINADEVDVSETLRELTGGRGPDACIDAVGLEAHGHGPVFLYDQARRALVGQPERPQALHEAIRACRNGGVVSIIGVYGDGIAGFPLGTVMNRGLTLRAGQCNVQRYMHTLLEHIQRGELDPTFVITHRLPLEEAARGFAMFRDRTDDCEKVVLRV
jgi:threonine dehydrogenase-like Zn-dependent dehydrogenase